MTQVHALQRWLGLSYAATLFALLAWSGNDHSTDGVAPASTLAFLRHFIHYGLFHGEEAGTAEHRYPARVDPTLLQPGDVIFCHNPHGVYGYWSHVTIVLDSQRVLMQDIATGISAGSISSLNYYDEILVLRPRAPAAMREQAARMAACLIGRPFNLSAHPYDLSQWSCAKSVWAAYAEQGIAIADGRFWITPDALISMPATSIQHAFAAF